MCSFGFFPEEIEGAPFVYGVGDIIDITWTASDKKLKFAKRHGVEQSEVVLTVDDSEAKHLDFFTMLTGPGNTIEIVE